MWEVFTEKDGVEVSYRWVPTKKKAEAFAINKLVKEVEITTEAIKLIYNLNLNVSEMIGMINIIEHV